MKMMIRSFPSGRVEGGRSNTAGQPLRCTTIRLVSEQPLHLITNTFEPTCGPGGVLCVEHYIDYATLISTGGRCKQNNLFDGNSTVFDLDQNVII